MRRARRHGQTCRIICEQALNLQRNAWPDIAFSTDFPQETVEIVCDQSQVGQALTNLLQNAADAIEGREPAPDGTLPPGAIDVAIHLAETQVQVVVTDNGRGLPKDERDRLTRLDDQATIRGRITDLRDRGFGISIDCDR